jgi:DNA-binding CsgD family transcriptional regulator
MPNTVRFTKREEQVLHSMVQGDSCKEAGRRLGITEKTIKHYRTVILSKMEARNAPHAVALAYQRGFIRLDKPVLETPKPVVPTVTQMGLFWAMSTASAGGAH